MELSSPVTSILLIEANVSGHRLFYIRLLLAEALSRGYSVHLATLCGAPQSPEFRTHLHDLEHKIALTELPDLSLETIARLSSDLKSDLTIIPDGDATAFKLATVGKWHGNGHLSLLIMREYAQSDPIFARRVIKQLAKRILMLRVQNLPDIDLVVLKSATWSGKSRTKIALDPVVVTCTSTDVARIRKTWNLDTSRYWFGVLGAITARKNLPLLLNCLADLAPERCGLLVAGSIDETVKSDLEASILKLHGLAVPVVVVDKLLSDVELDAGVAAVDCLILAHSNEGPSGLLGKAASVGTRVLAAGARSLRRDIATLDQAAEWTRLSRPAITKAMKRAMLSDPPGQPLRPSSESFTSALLPSRKTFPLT